MGTSTDKYQKKKKMSYTQERRAERLQKRSELTEDMRKRRNILKEDHINAVK